jgi:hypothetical protein
MQQFQLQIKLIIQNMKNETLVALIVVHISVDYN